MKTIKLYDGVTVTVDGESQTVESIADLWEILNITKEICGDGVDEIRRGITANLLGFGRIDLSDAYRGHTVLLSLIPAKKKEE